MKTLSHILSSLLIILFWSIGFGVISYTEAADFKIVVNPGTNDFAPQVTKIKLGDNVSWENVSSDEHYVTSAGPETKQVVIGIEDLEIHTDIAPGASFTYSFKEPGIYHYFCGVHDGMWGTVIVEK